MFYRPNIQIEDVEKDWNDNNKNNRCHVDLISTREKISTLCSSHFFSIHESLCEAIIFQFRMWQNFADNLWKKKKMAEINLFKISIKYYPFGIDYWTFSDFLFNNWLKCHTVSSLSVRVSGLVIMHSLDLGLVVFVLWDINPFKVI